MVFAFDLDDTLYDLSGSFKKTHEELFADRVSVPCLELFYASRKYNKEAFDLWNKGLINKTEEFAYRIRKSYEQYGCSLTEEEIEQFRVKYRNYQDHIQLMDGIGEILELLKEKDVKLLILTNGNHDDQWKKIKALKLDEIFEHIFVSEDLIAPKPELEAYRAIEEALGLKGETVYYVGDTFEIDIVGAYNAGWKSIWFNHRGKELPEGEVVPDYTVSSVEELLEVIEGISQYKSSKNIGE